ncbi:hypothetical protein [Cohnella boryungensis]|uniref:Uncharacterized protein n=1 Tax=Cohnella boryungensis TaxID=768479 RepID=A0ABV8S9G4_9BACL
MSERSSGIPSPSKRRAFLINIISHSLYILALPVALFLSLFSVMLFDAPGSEKHWPSWALYYGLNSFPYVAVAAIVLGWIFYRLGLYKLTYFVNSIPLAILLVCTGVLVSFD